MEKQLIPFITLIRLLKDKYNCFQGAVQLLQAIDSVILRSDNPPELTPGQVNAYFDLCLEEDMKAANPERMLLLERFCCNKLKTLQQFCLATHLAVHHSALPLFTELLTAIAHNSNLNVTSRIKKYAVELLFCYLDAGLSDLFNELAPKLLVDPEVVKAILSSTYIWDLANPDGGLGRAELVAVLPSFVKMRIAHLTVLLEQNPNPSNVSIQESLSDFLHCYTNEEDEDVQHPRDEKWIRYDLSMALKFTVLLMDTTGLTDLEGLAILDPLLSKLSPVRLGQLVVDSLVYNKEKSESSKSLFVELCRKVRITEPLHPDKVIRLLEVFSNQGAASEDLINSLFEGLPGRPPAVYSSIFKAFLTSYCTYKFPDLMKVFTSKLMAAWIPAVVAMDDAVAAETCVEMLIELKNRPFRPDVDPAPLSPFIARMTTKSIRNLLNLLYNQMRDQSERCQLDRDLIFEFLGRANTIQLMGNTLVDAYSKMLKCLIWVGDRPCMDSFIDVLSAALDGPSLAVQLALSSSFRFEFRTVPVRSSSWNVCCVLLDYCIEGLGRIWKQTEAVVPGYPGIQNFLRSTSQMMVLDGFDDRIEEAHHFCQELRRSYLVMAQVRGLAKTLRVEIAKVIDGAWLAECSKDSFHCNDRLEKLDILVALRNAPPICEPLLRNETAGTKRFADPLSNPLDAKRRNNIPAINID